MSLRKSIKSTKISKPDTILTSAMEARKKAVTAARQRRPTVNNITAKMRTLSIPKVLETKGTIMKTLGDNNVELQLSRDIVYTLKDIYELSARESIEIAGLIECTFDTNYASFVGPTLRTNYKRTSVYFPHGTPLTKMTYHSHPAPQPTLGGTYVSVPSDTDLNTFIEVHKTGVIEANLILDQQGMYVVDVLTPKENSRGKEMFDTILTEIKKVRGFDYIVKDTILLFNVDVNRWKNFINNRLDAIMIKKYGVSLRFYRWGDLPSAIVNTFPRSL